MNRIRKLAEGLLICLMIYVAITAIFFVVMLADRYFFPNEIPGPGFFGALYPQTVTPAP